MSRVAAPPGRMHLAGCVWFWAWAVVGCGAALSAVSLGPILSIPTALAGVLMARRPIIRWSAFGLLTGAGTLLLYVAYVQRGGPGTACWHTATSAGCAEHLDPLPWLVAGAVLVVTGIVAHRVKALRRRRR